MDLRGAHVLITGGSKGTGAALARGLAGRGSRLTVIARPSRELTKVAEDTGAVALTADLSDLASVDGIVACAEQANGPVDILVNMAAMADTGPFAELTAEQLRAGVHANMLAHMEMADCFAGDRARATMTIPRTLALLTQARLLPSRCLQPFMLWPAVAEARRQRAARPPTADSPW